MLCGLADGVDALVAQGLTVHRVVLIGGASRSAAVQEVARQLFGVPVTVPAPAEYVALGAARQAAWALAGDAHPPRWERPDQLDLDAEDAAAGREVRERYRAFQARVHPR
jgi:xylulokinase